ncbi:MAG: hypothetical protein H0X63_02385 [Flavobacteriales bacterium]|jgi:hypothetical protein|nr:hypothetical protein [Flavobacteriales bacterium]
MKYIIILLLFPIEAMTQITVDEDDYAIINLVLNDYSELPFFQTPQPFYLKKVVGNDFKIDCISYYTNKINTSRSFEKNCEKMIKPVTDSVGISFACEMKNHYSKYLNLLNENELIYFKKQLPRKDPLLLNQAKLNTKYASVVNQFPKYSGLTSKIFRTLTLNGPFYNETKDKAFMESYKGSIYPSSHSEKPNCILFIKENGAWKIAGYFSSGRL